MPFEFTKLEIPDVVHIHSQTFPDERGAFAERFKASEFAAQGIELNFKQVNQSTSKQHVLRALHYQKHPKAQAKLVMVTKGEVFDVAVDIRKGSPTYGQWVGVTLTAEKKNMLFVPVGFAHGFCTLTPEADFVYFCTDEYSLENEAGIIWNDPTIGIKWPVEHPILSDKDKQHPTLEAADNNFTYE